jgi:5-methylcytosine-specific restriction endonuclease McrA
MSGPDNIKKKDRLRARDGDNCWLCGQLIDFEAEPNSSKAWSVEHLLSKDHDGPGRIENLVLCHPPCNRSLANRPLFKKIEMREKRRRKIWMASIRGQILKALGK